MPIQLFANKETDKDPALLSPWSIPHFFVGMAAKERGVPFWWFQLGHGLYEMKDQYEHIKQIQHNTLVNSLGDQAIATVGHVVGKTNTKSYLWTTAYILSWLGAIYLGDAIG